MQVTVAGQPREDHETKQIAGGHHLSRAPLNQCQACFFHGDRVLLRGVDPHHLGGIFNGKTDTGLWPIESFDQQSPLTARIRHDLESRNPKAAPAGQGQEVRLVVHQQRKFRWRQLHDGFASVS